MKGIIRYLICLMVLGISFVILFPRVFPYIVSLFYNKHAEELERAEEMGIIELYDENGLNWNISLGKIKLVEEQLASGINPNEKEIDYPLTVAIKSDYSNKMTKLLLKYGAVKTNSNSFPWEIIAYVKEKEVKIELLKEYECDSQEWNRVVEDYEDECKSLFIPHFALGLAAFNGEKEVVSMLLKSRESIDVNLQDDYGRTALMLACFITDKDIKDVCMVKNKIWIAEKLLLNDANVFVKDYKGNTSMDYFQKSILNLKAAGLYGRYKKILSV